MVGEPVAHHVDDGHAETCECIRLARKALGNLLDETPMLERVGRPKWQHRHVRYVERQNAGVGRALAHSFDQLSWEFLDMTPNSGTMAATDSRNRSVCACGANSFAATTTGTKASSHSSGLSRISLTKGVMPPPTGKNCRQPRAQAMSEYVDQYGGISMHGRHMGASSPHMAANFAEDPGRCPETGVLFHDRGKSFVLEPGHLLDLACNSRLGLRECTF